MARADLQPSHRTIATRAVSAAPSQAAAVALREQKAAAGWAPEPARAEAARVAGAWLRGSAGQAARLGSTVTADPARPAEPRTRAAQQQARDDLRAIAPEVLKAQGSLSARDARLFAVVERAVTDDKNPAGRMALTQLLLDGALHAVDGEGVTLLERLGALATRDPQAQAPLTGGLDRKALLSELVQELAQPATIEHVGEKNETAAAATVAMLLASTRPAEYARVVSALARPSGSVSLVSGAVLSRSTPTGLDDGRGRTAVQRLLQPALMELGNGQLDYSNTSDRHSAAGLPLFRGASPSMVKRMLEGVLGTKAEAKGGRLLGPRAADVRRLEATTGQGVPVPTVLSFARPGEPPKRHWVLTTAVDRDTVQLINPDGREERMSRRLFDEQLQALVFPG